MVDFGSEGEWVRDRLAKHRRWLQELPGGERARLTGRDLSGWDLTGVDLTKTDLSGAILNGAILKRAFKLSKFPSRPDISMLVERNTRKGFFERDAFEDVRAHLPDAIKPVATFSYYTGWPALRGGRQ